MHWYKEAYKKNTKQHLHGGKRERLGSNCLVHLDLEEDLNASDHDA